MGLPQVYRVSSQTEDQWQSKQVPSSYRWTSPHTYLNIGHSSQFPFDPTEAWRCLLLSLPKCWMFNLFHNFQHNFIFVSPGIHGLSLQDLFRCLRCRSVITKKSHVIRPSRGGEWSFVRWFADKNWDWWLTFRSFSSHFLTVDWPVCRMSSSSSDSTRTKYSALIPLRLFSVWTGTYSLSRWNSMSEITEFEAELCATTVFDGGGGGKKN